MPTVEKTAIERSENRNSTKSWRAGGVASRIFRGRSGRLRTIQSVNHTDTAKIA